jgi:hypothetical protein
MFFYKLAHWKITVHNTKHNVIINDFTLKQCYMLHNNGCNNGFLSVTISGETLLKRYPDICWIGSWVGSRSGLHTAAIKRKVCLSLLGWSIVVVMVRRWKGTDANTKWLSCSRKVNWTDGNILKSSVQPIAIVSGWKINISALHRI